MDRFVLVVNFMKKGDYKTFDKGKISVSPANG